MDDSVSPPLPSVSFVVPTYRRPHALRTTLVALLAVDYPPDRYEVIVVDDGSGDDTAAVVAGLQDTTRAKLTYVTQDNAGAATARNRGARVAVGEILIFVDDDIVVEPGHVHDHLAAGTGQVDVLVNGYWEFPPEMVASMERTPFGRFRLWVEDWVKEGLARQPLGDGLESPMAVSACDLGVNRALFWQLGGFDETFPFAGCEDLDLSVRALAAGCRLVYDRRIRLIHNDQRLTLTQFCGRQRRGACTAVYLASRHPEQFARRPLIVENSPLARSDPPRIIIKKLLKQGLSWPPALVAVHSAIRVLERLAPRSRLLKRAYWITCGLYIFRGIRDGFAALGTTTTVALRPEETRCRS